MQTPEGRTVSGRLTSNGQHITVTADDLETLAAGRDGGDLRRLAGQVAERGLVVEIGDDDGPLMRVGAVRRRFLHRLVTGTRHAQVVRWRAASALKAQVVAGSGDTLAAPPVALVNGLPRMPWLRRSPTTTHDPYGGGHPRLYLADSRVASTGREVGVMHLAPGTTRIGSGEEAEVRLDGMDAVQAVVERTEDDEYVLKAVGRSVHTFMNGRELPTQTLRTGCRIEIGPWRLTYVRDEYADHGRPFSGRVGGELGRQRAQNTPRYQR
ncbi:FHA domain-containing protein [Aeromicrobium sp. CF4.19]|uniref:FHA domain-containing protein n=1 Tax=Aeromicrobium sp. CF4.19 TaxID=3373082 RepID=UPI003EE68E3F